MTSYYRSTLIKTNSVKQNHNEVAWKCIYAYWSERLSTFFTWSRNFL